MRTLIKRTVTEVFECEKWSHTDHSVKISRIYRTVYYEHNSHEFGSVTFKICGWNPFPIIGEFKSSTSVLFKWYLDNGWTHPEHVKTIVNNTEVEY